MIPQWILHFDGLCEPNNPGGCMAWGWSLQIPGQSTYTSYGGKLPAQDNTNNVAEYAALYFGLKAAVKKREEFNPEPWPGLLIYGDSKLVCQQVANLWKVKQPRLQKAHAECLKLLEHLTPWCPEWIPREQNNTADMLSRLGYRALMGSDPPERRKTA